MIRYYANDRLFPKVGYLHILGKIYKEGSLLGILRMSPIKCEIKLFIVTR